MSWGLGGWKRQVDAYHLKLGFGDEELADGETHSRLLPLTSSAFDLASNCRFRIHFDWSAGEDEDQAALKLQSQLLVTLPAPHDQVFVEFQVRECALGQPFVYVDMSVRRRREPLKVLSLSRTVGPGPPVDGLGTLAKLLTSGSVEKNPQSSVAEGLLGYIRDWRLLTVMDLSNCFLTAFPVDLSLLPMLEKLYLENNKIVSLPAELGQLKHLQVLNVDHNALLSVPAELRQCMALIELSLEHNKLVRPLLDFREMAELRILRLFGNPLEFLPEILPCTNLRYLSLANVRIEGDEQLAIVNVKIEAESASYFVQPKHKLSAFFALIFRFSSCQHPLLASALAKIAEDTSNRAAMGKDESAVRQLLSMMLSDDGHVVEQACIALSSLAADGTLVLRLMKADIMQAIESVLKSSVSELLISVLKLMVNLAFSSDVIASRMLTKDILKRLKLLCAHGHAEVQCQALLALGNLAFCRDNRCILVTVENLRELLLRLSSTLGTRVSKAAIRALSILGENEYVRRATKGRPIGKRGVRILSMDGGGMRGLAAVQMLRKIEQGTGKRIHEIFDLICGTSTGGMLAVALGIKKLSLDQCEETYKNLGKVVFSEPFQKDNEAATWKEKLDQLYKSSSQNFRVVVHGSKHNADQFERLLKDMCSDEDGDLLIESAVKGVPKVFVVSTLVSVIPAQPFVFRNYQYPPGTPEITSWTTEGPAASVCGTPATAAPLVTQVGPRRSAFIGSCKHRTWEAIRASSAAPYYLDDFSIDLNRWQDGAIVANNPTLIAIREAQLLWPDVQIACLVSIGCGNLPTKSRGKGGWRYLDTGQVLIESACSVERVEEALDTLLPMLPDIQYFRFNPVDERCGMEMDETDPAEWAKLEAATQEYIEANVASFQAACDYLTSHFPEGDNMIEKTRAARGVVKGQCFTGNKGYEEKGSGLGWRRNILLVEACRSPELSKPFRHTHTVKSFCSKNKIKVEHLLGACGILNSTASTATPLASPLFVGSIPPSPLPFSPDYGPQLAGRLEIPPLSLDSSDSPMLGPRQLSGPVVCLHEKLQSSQQVGVIQLSLHSDSVGLILSWRNDIIAVAEPGEMAEGFLQKVMTSMRLSPQSANTKTRQNLVFPKLSDLVSEHTRFVLDGVLHCFMGRHTQILQDGQEVGAFLFRRTLPAAHLTAEDVKWMIGAWRDRIVVCTGKYGPTPALITAFLEAGAKAIIAPSLEPPDSSVLRNHNAIDKPDTETRFVIGDEEDDDDIQTGSNESDWEDSDFERNESRTERQEIEERDLAAFLCLLYDALFKEGIAVELALKRAAGAHPKQRYMCHLPKQ